ncbi:MAG TPA: gfo/Idh/MocA family oxidoreductase [Planctomycetaceae bacterium]|jgi:myo-inositol 2-dehydrogenase/D-chiro-inositol 1-dehydrogenase|nr:gfo/Idh/MocA family oxidoreductase [Planctomycetaceae bacterium]|tara:strand:+ start:5215 stop:6543 length:1329 start_codon:yes stop_codon:yes gene_type:complete
MTKRHNQSLSATRRRFLKSTSALAGAALINGGIHSHVTAQNEKPKSPNERLQVGAIGLRYQGTVISVQARQYADVVAFCDADQHVREQARSSFGSTPRIYEDYRDFLEKSNVDVVLIGTPDHWHVKMAADALRAGKDVYVEKPLSLTIEEGKFLREVVKSTGRVLQVGSWQRSDNRFRLAIEMVRAGRIGKLQSVDVVLGKNKQGGPFKQVPVPNNLNWDLWQGQTPDMPYIQERCHYTFRWWYAYSGGQMTDWGAHHLDIAQWGINSHPVEITGTAKYPTVENGFDVAVDFHATYKYANGVTMNVADNGRNGIMFNGSEGRIFVNRGTIAGKPVEDLESNPLPREDFAVYDYDNLDRPPRAGKLDAITNHMGNFFDCIAARRDPISDVESQHRSVSTCHLGNIAMRVGRTLKWDPELETFPDDADARDLMRRDQRDGYEVS